MNMDDWIFSLLAPRLWMNMNEFFGSTVAFYQSPNNIWENWVFGLEYFKIVDTFDKLNTKDEQSSLKYK